MPAGDEAHALARFRQGLQAFHLIWGVSSECSEGKKYV
jgi:hypothetical protein